MVEFILGAGLIVVFWFVFPPFRKFFLVGVISVVLLITGFIIYSTNESNYREKVSKSLISISQVQLDNLTLNQQYGSYQLSGEVKNNSSEHNLSDVYLKVTAYDCPEASITSSCTTIGEDDSVDISVNVPPNQVRAIDKDYVYLDSMPKAKGTFLWSYTITGTRGR